MFHLCFIKCTAINLCKSTKVSPSIGLDTSAFLLFWFTIAVAIVQEEASSLSMSLPLHRHQIIQQGILKNVQKACQSVTSNSFLAPKFIVLHHRTLLLPPTKPNPVDTHQRNHFANHFYHNSRWEIPHHHQPTIQASSWTVRLYHLSYPFTFPS